MANPDPHRPLLRPRTIRHDQRTVHAPPPDPQELGRVLSRAEQVRSLLELGRGNAVFRSRL